MSAIVAAAGPRLSERTRRWVIEATAHSAIAGPDRQAVTFGPCWGLGHALLSTGLDGADQPLTGDGRVWLAADTRLDARAELLSSLQAHGQPVGSASDDPQLLLAAYHAWGEAFLQRIAGDFAFALWDDARGRLMCGRDQIGVAQLHYARVGQEVLVATALSALLLHPDVSDELDEDALCDFLVMGRGDFASTTFRAIKRIPPAHVVSLTGQDFTPRRYWRQPEWPPLVRFKEPGDYIARFRDLLETAVAERITSDRLAVHVSGGMDSTTVAALAHQCMRRQGMPQDSILGATMELGGDTGDQEGHYARIVARSLGIELDTVEEFSATPMDPFASPGFPRPEPSPYEWTSVAHDSLLRSAAHAHVLLSGLPGDSLVMCISWYWAEWLARGRIVRLSRALADNARLFGDRPHPDLRRAARHVRTILRRPTPKGPAWLAPDFARRTSASRRVMPAGLVPAAAVDVRSIAGEPFWPSLFGWGDPTFTGVPVRIRHPLADLRLIDFASRLPPEPWLINKRILRDAASGLLPSEVLTRRKTARVRARRAFITPQALERLAQLVQITPGLGQFFDLGKLTDAIAAPNAAIEHPDDQLLMRALGLAYWCAHRRRPNAAERPSQEVRVTSAISDGMGANDRSTSSTSAGAR